MELAQLMETVRGFQKAQAILTAHRLGVFRVIAHTQRTAEWVANELKCSPRGITILLDAMVSLGVLRKEGGYYQNSPVAKAHLCLDSEDYRGTSFDHMHDLMNIWSRLEESVRSGRPCRREEEHLMAGSTEKNEVFIGAMAEIGRPNARIIAQALDLSRYRSFVDVGGGPGVYCEEVLRVNPQMRAVVADLPLTVATAQQIVAKGAFAERISFLCVDVFHDSTAHWKQKFDVALVSNLLHMEGAEPNRALLTKIHTILNENGMIILHEGIIDQNRTAPMDRALFAINMLVNTERGDCYTFEEMHSWLLDAGFSEIQAVDCFEQPSLITARKLRTDAHPA